MLLQSVSSSTPNFSRAFSNKSLLSVSQVISELQMFIILSIFALNTIFSMALEANSKISNGLSACACVWEENEEDEEGGKLTIDSLFR